MRMKRVSIQTGLAWLLILAGFTGILALRGVAEAAPETSVQHHTGELSPMKEHKGLTGEIVRQITRSHFSRITIDDTFSHRVFDAYLSSLDPAKMHFLSSEIKELEHYGSLLDDALLSSDVMPAFEIYHHYHLRASERLTFLIEQVSRGLADMPLDTDETIELVRRDAPWPTSRAQLENLWLQTLKSEVISLRLTDKAFHDIEQTLLTRFKAQLHRLEQTTSEDVFQIYMNAVAQIHDPHTQYFSPRSSENFHINMSLSLEGIGAMLTIENEYTKVVRLIPAGPADRSGLIKPNDRIIGVGQGPQGQIVDVVGWRLDDVVDLIRGPKETIVRLRIIPADSTALNGARIVVLTRSTVRLEEQAAQKDIITLERGEQPFRIGIVKIPTFYLDMKALQSGDAEYKSTTRDVQRILGELASEDISGLIIDLRENGGGSLQEATTLTGLFIRTGPTVQIKYSDADVDVLYDRDPRIFYTGPLAVIINRMSASASEIFAGAIQDYRRGLVIGETSFGKGTVQSLIPLSRGQMKITTAKFYRISGASTQHKGVVPDLVYPSLYDHDTLGESSLENALPWDRIDPVPYQVLAPLASIDDKLRERHETRIIHDPDFVFLGAMIDYLDQSRKKTTVSLNLSRRKQELEESRRHRLELENTRRAAKELPLIQKIEEESEDDGRKAETPAQEDPVLMESGHVLLDYIELSTRNLPGHLVSGM
ncbi:MAG TPA: tail-specific protease [Deltaproteobacteria bacterium]|nr:tail-specific protease [Deltaproteobacteria bacterium]